MPVESLGLWNPSWVWVGRTFKGRLVQPPPWAGTPSLEQVAQSPVHVQPCFLSYFNPICFNNFFFQAKEITEVEDAQKRCLSSVLSICFGQSLSIKWFINWFSKCIAKFLAFPLIHARNTEEFKKPLPNKSLCFSLMHKAQSLCMLQFFQRFCHFQEQGQKKISLKNMEFQIWISLHHRGFIPEGVINLTDQHKLVPGFLLSLVGL